MSTVDIKDDNFEIGKIYDKCDTVSLYIMMSNTKKHLKDNVELYKIGDIDLIYNYDLDKFIVLKSGEYRVTLDNILIIHDENNSKIDKKIIRLDKFNEINRFIYYANNFIEDVLDWLFSTLLSPDGISIIIAIVIVIVFRKNIYIIMEYFQHY